MKYVHRKIEKKIQEWVFKIIHLITFKKTIFYFKTTKILYLSLEKTSNSEFTESFESNAF